MSKSIKLSPKHGVTLQSLIVSAVEKRLVLPCLANSREMKKLPEM